MSLDGAYLHKALVLIVLGIGIVCLRLFSDIVLSQTGRELLLLSLRGREVQEGERLEKRRLGMARRCLEIVNPSAKFQ